MIKTRQKTTLIYETSYDTRDHNGIISSLGPKLGSDYFSTFYGLNAVVENTKDLNTLGTRSFLLSYKSDSYLDVLNLLTSKERSSIFNKSIMSDQR